MAKGVDLQLLRQHVVRSTGRLGPCAGHATTNGVQPTTLAVCRLGRFEPGERNRSSYTKGYVGNQPRLMIRQILARVGAYLERVGTRALLCHRVCKQSYGVACAITQSHKSIGQSGTTRKRLQGSFAVLA